MHLLVVVGVVAVFLFVEGMGQGDPGWITMLLDSPSLIVLLFITISVLLSSGLLKDFSNAFRLFFGKKRQGETAEKKKAVEALDVVMKSLHYGAVFAILLQFTVLCNVMEPDNNVWWFNMAVLFIPLLYAYILNLLLLPIRSRLNKEVIDYLTDVDDKE